MPRLPLTTFRLPWERIRAGWQSDSYFNRARQVLFADQHTAHVRMQVFTKHHAVLCGIDWALALLKVGAGHYRDPARAAALFERHLAFERRAATIPLASRCWEEEEPVAREWFEIRRELADLWEPAELEVHALADGDEIAPYETVLTIDGDYKEFAHLETLYLAALASSTRVATNTRNVVRAARGKPVLMFAARHDTPLTQAPSGYAAFIGGASAAATDEQGEWWGSRGVGTIPHALIASYGGSTTLAAIKFAELVDPPLPVTTLVDFDNDSVATSLRVARALGGRLAGVRLDTAENMVDRAIWEAIQAGAPADPTITGVTPRLVRAVREALDAAGFREVRIVASGGFDAAKVAAFEAEGAPVDVYGVGSGLLAGRYDFTADVVRVNGAPLAKKGRAERPNPRLRAVAWEEIV
jgi:nicotinate phosphoribosyltransferase